MWFLLWAALILASWLGGFFPCTPFFEVCTELVQFECIDYSYLNTGNVGLHHVTSYLADFEVNKTTRAYINPKKAREGRANKQSQQEKAKHVTQFNNLKGRRSCSIGRVKVKSQSSNQSSPVIQSAIQSSN